MTDISRPYEKKRKTIVHLTSVHPAFDTRIFVKECQSLLSNGYEVHLIAQFEQEEKIDGVLIKALPKVHSKKERITRVFPAIWRKVWSYPKGTVFHFHDSELIPLCLLLKLFGYKIIYDIHEHTPKDFITKDWLPIWLRYPLSLFVYFLEYLSGIFFDGIVTVVPPVSNRFRKRNFVEISNYPKLDDVYFNYVTDLTTEKRNNKVVYIGSLTKIRGTEAMIDAINLVNDKYEPILKLGGKFVPESYDEELKSLKDFSRIKQLGWLRMDEIWRELSSSNIGLVVLQPTPAHVVLESVKMFEYMAAGLPVIASDFPLYRRIVEDSKCGILVNPTNPKEISDAIEWLFENPDLGIEMGRRGKEAVFEKYNWKNEEKELLNFYHGI